MDTIESKIKVVAPIEYEDWFGHPSLILKRDWSKAKAGDVPKTEKCPFCGNRHIHGGNSGHRAAHCGYPPYITCVASDGTILSSQYGYVLVDINKPE